MISLEEAIETAAANSYNPAPIHAACARQDLSILKLLLDHSANPNKARPSPLLSTTPPRPLQIHAY